MYIHRLLTRTLPTAKKTVVEGNATTLVFNRFFTSKLQDLENNDKKNEDTVSDRKLNSQFREYYRNKPYTPVDLKTSIEYMKSSGSLYRTNLTLLAYTQVYTDLPVWFHYRRNFKGTFPPKHPRRNCVFSGKIASANPCPICRDDHLVIDYRNVHLIQQFINPVTVEVHPASKTGLCEHQHDKLLLEYVKAVDIGTIQMRLPFVLYDYSDYYDVTNDIKDLEGYQVYAELHSHLNAQKFDQLSISKLPPNLNLLLQENKIIDHVREYTAESQDYIPKPPKMPNRYKMEEDHKAFLLKRKRSRSMLIN